ncbi:MAG TPA: RNA 2',3'-cyclic phosphodiesterase [Candidatus Thermoplasmatota archaeon]|nr:RNA 2',3'-cyclic phosphodiesterase [Candidatus Thermoplasmatota archaeon]
MPFRAFAGVPVPADPRLLALLDGLRATRGDLKVVEPGNLHMTLSFLGQVPDEAAGPLSRALDEAAARFAPFRAQLSGVGAFPSARRPRVVWAGVQDPAPLAALANAVRDAFARAGHAGDDKDFRAHATLARVREGSRADDVARFLQRHASDPLPEIEVADARLYRSVPSPRGPTYEVVHAARLGG